MKDRFSAVEQQLGQKIWTIVRLFYRSHVAFKELFERYEKKVGGYSQVLGLPRDHLRLNSRELASLLDLKSMERIRDGYIHELKDLCHLRAIAPRSRGFLCGARRAECARDKHTVKITGCATNRTLREGLRRVRGSAPDNPGRGQGPCTPSVSHALTLPAGCGRAFAVVCGT